MNIDQKIYIDELKDYHLYLYVAHSSSIKTDDIPACLDNMFEFVCLKDRWLIFVNSQGAKISFSQDSLKEKCMLVTGRFYTVKSILENVESRIIKLFFYDQKVFMEKGGE